MIDRRAWLLTLLALALGCGGAAQTQPGPDPQLCASHMTWRLGDQESVVMHPGGACNSCHAQRGVEAFTLAGTVYSAAGAHDPDECFGFGGATVIITDATDAVFTVTSNASGNFSFDHTDGAIALPYRAKLTRGGQERAMLAPQMSGDCNGCHTAAGANQAPGRIMAP